MLAKKGCLPRVLWVEASGLHHSSLDSESLRANRGFFQNMFVVLIFPLVAYSRFSSIQACQKIAADDAHECQGQEMAEERYAVRRRSLTSTLMLTASTSPSTSKDLHQIR